MGWLWLTSSACAPTVFTWFCRYLSLCCSRQCHSARPLQIPGAAGKSLAAGPDNIHYSRLDQINRDNVHSLQVAWTFDSGDQHPESEMECNPIVVDGVLYATTPNGDVVALDAATGALHWRFIATEGTKKVGKIRNRGVTYWADGNDTRIFVGGSRVPGGAGCA